MAEQQFGKSFMSKIRLGIIGCGDMEGAHQETFNALADRVVITGTADIDISKAQYAAAKLGADHAVQDYRELFPYVDAVLVVTPHNLHHEMGVTSLKAGKHVLMEKPLAISEAECLDLIETAKATGKTLMTAYPMRFQPLVVKLKELIDTQYLGEIFHVGIYTDSPYIYQQRHKAKRDKCAKPVTDKTSRSKYNAQTQKQHPSCNRVGRKRDR